LCIAGEAVCSTGWPITPKTPVVPEIGTVLEIGTVPEINKSTQFLKSTEPLKSTEQILDKLIRDLQAFTPGYVIGKAD
jgi:hypothetical protein